MTIGDAEKVNINSLTVNGVYIFNNVPLQANQFDTAAIDVNVSDGIIVIKADCDDSDPPGHCKHVWSRMNAVYVTQLEEDPNKAENEAGGTENMGCGNSYRGGRC